MRGYCLSYRMTLIFVKKYYFNVYGRGDFILHAMSLSGGNELPYRRFVLSEYYCLKYL